MTRNTNAWQPILLSLMSGMIPAKMITKEPTSFKSLVLISMSPPYQIIHSWSIVLDIQANIISD